MADGGEKESCNEIPQNSDYILFAEDLVNYVLTQISPTYTAESDRIPYRQLVENPVDEVIERSLCDILGLLKKNAIYGFVMRNHPNINLDGYTRLINILEQDAFDQGFTGRFFLIYSVNISYLAALFYNHGVDSAPETAKTHIINVLKTHMPPYGWSVVRRAAEIYPLAEAKSETSDSE